MIPRKSSTLNTLLPMILIGTGVAFAQPTDPLVVRHDEAVALDHIEFSASATCTPQGSPALSVWFEKISFHNGAGTELAAVDIGTQADSYYLGQGWMAREGTAQTNGRWTDAKSSFFFAIPAGATTMRFSAVGSCVAVAMQVTVNGTASGSFNTAANATLANYTITLPASLSQQVTYSVLSGGPISIASLQWLNQAGVLISTSATAVTVTGSPQSQSVVRPAGASSFCVNFSSSPPASLLKVSINGAAAGEYVVTFAPAGPQISTITGAASGQEGSLAPGEFFTIKGTNLGPTNFATGFDKGLGGARVFTNGIENFITYSQAGQLNVVLSNAIPASGFAEVVVEFNGVRSDPAVVGLAPAAPGIFTQEYGPGHAWVFNQDNSVNAPNNRAAKGSFIFFYASGAGLTAPVLTDGSHPSGGIFPSPTGEVQVLLNGKAIPQENIVFKSLTFAAVLQVNLKLPDDAPSGEAVDLKISIGGHVSRDGVRMSIQ